MFCQNCGSKLSENAMFCENCGEKVTDELTEMQHKEQNTNELENQTLSKKDKTPLPKKTKGIILLVSIVAVVLIIVAVNFKSTIKLNDYLVVEYSGYNSLGKAEVTLDKKKFREDYADKLRYKGDNQFANIYDDSSELFLDECVEGSVSKEEKLSNGDTITYSWKCNDEVAKKDFGVKLKYSDADFKVADLTEIKMVDPFEKVSIEYTGVSPKGTADIKIESDEDYLADIRFNIDPYENLSNGDTVKVNFNSYYGTSMEEYLAENYGIGFSQMEKEYTVENLGSYINKLADIPDETMEALKKQTEEQFRAYVAKDWVEKEKLENMTYLGSYLLIPKASAAYTNCNNEIVLVYRIDASDNYEDEGIHDAFSFYYKTSFTDLVKLPDGTCTVDLSKGQGTGNNFRREVKYGSKSWEYDGFYYHGYETLDTLTNKEIIANIDNYEYESNVEDITKDTDVAQPEQESSEALDDEQEAE